jgi:hypothetical protein
VKLITDSGEQTIELSRQTLDQTIATLKIELKQGTPIAIEHHTISGVTFPTKYTYTKEIFITDGNIIKNEDSIAIGTKKERNEVRVEVETKSNLQGDKLLPEKEPRISIYHDRPSTGIIIPWTSLTPDMHDKAFHPQEPPRLNLGGAATTEINIGKYVETTYEKYLNMATFASKAMIFELPFTYRNHLYYMNLKEYDSNISIIVSTINALMILMNNKRKPVNFERLDNFTTLDLTYFIHQFESYKKSNPFIENTDIPIIGSQHRGSPYCFVKFNSNNVFVLPTKGNEELIENSLSKENIEKYFPR